MRVHLLPDFVRNEWGAVGEGFPAAGDPGTAR